MKRAIRPLPIRTWLTFVSVFLLLAGWGEGRMDGAQPGGTDVSPRYLARPAGPELVLHRASLRPLSRGLPRDFPRIETPASDSGRGADSALADPLRAYARNLRA